MESYNAHELTDVLDAFSATSTLKATWGDVAANYGDELTPTQVQKEPSISLEPVDRTKFYTFLMTDPDAPTRSNATFREIKHWLVVNVPGADIASGEVIAEYIGSGAPEGTGLHRYAFYAFLQPCGTKIDFSSEVRTPNTSREGRLKFCTRDFVSKYDLTPIAWNMFQAQYDEYVLVLRAQLGGNPPKP